MKSNEHRNIKSEIQRKFQNLSIAVTINNSYSKYYNIAEVLVDFQRDYSVFDYGNWFARELILQLNMCLNNKMILMWLYEK